MNVGEIRCFTCGSRKHRKREVVILEIHDEPRVDWTNEPTCLVGQGGKDTFVWKQSRLEELTKPTGNVKAGAL